MMKLRGPPSIMTVEISDNIAFSEIDGLESKTLLDDPEKSSFKDGLDGPESKGYTRAIDCLETRNPEGQPDLIQCTDETINFLVLKSSFLNEREALYFCEVISIDSTDKQQIMVKLDT